MVSSEPNIFWVRDQEPIGLLTLTQGAREFNVLVKGLLRLVKETVKPKPLGAAVGRVCGHAAGRADLPDRLVRLRRHARDADQARSARAQP